jgi:hypothetical protein
MTFVGPKNKLAERRKKTKKLNNEKATFFLLITKY